MTIQTEMVGIHATGTGENYAKNLECDILIIGAGFSGCYLLHELRKRGYKVKIYEAGNGLGGTWKWTQYPGARVDSDIPVYELSIPEIWKTWNWTERFPGWQELQAYFEHVEKVLNISKDVAFDTRVIEAQFDKNEGKWTVKTEDDRVCKCKYLLPCVGFAAKRYVPEWKGLETFKGTICHSSFWPKEDFDISGKKCAVIGTGSTGVQITQEWAKKADKLYVFQRTPNLALPMKQQKLTPDDQESKKKIHEDCFRKREAGFGGFTFTFVEKDVFDDPPDVQEEFFEKLWNKGDFSFWSGTYKNYLYETKANRVVYDFWAKKTRARLTDPKKRDLVAPLEPPHPFGTKRPSLELDYYEMLDRPSVEVVSIKNNPIVEIKENGIVLADGNFYEVDAIAVATGFDAITGSMIAAGLKDCDGNNLTDLWKDGVRTYLGISLPGFPNMFYTYGPQAPTAFANGPTLIEIQSHFIMDTIDKMEKEKIKYIEPTKEAVDEYVTRIHEFANQSLFPLADSWYMGANIPGKKREMLNYLGGIPRYSKEIKEIFNGGHVGFDLVK